MRKWEDIVRDKMEEPDGALPEGVFAEFQARLSGAAPAITRKHIRLLWVVATATAAALAAVMFIRQEPPAGSGLKNFLQTLSLPSRILRSRTRWFSRSVPLTGRYRPTRPSESPYAYGKCWKCRKRTLQKTARLR